MKRYAMVWYMESTLNGPACNVTMIETPHGEWVRYEDAERLRAENEALRNALLDCAGGLRYVRRNYGELYGVGFDRALSQSDAALTLNA